MQESKLQPGQRVGNYILQSKIGEGAFSEVWKAAHHERPNRMVAIKTATDASFRRYLTKETRLAEIKHDAVVQILDSDTRFADVPYVVMPIYEGGSLADLIARGRTGLPLDHTNCVLISILEGVGAAHSAGIIHRDLKPSNILFHAWEAEATVADFGLSLVPDSPELMRSMIQSLSMERNSGNNLVGTLAYMAPEIRDGTPASPSADVFSIGVIIFEMLTGHRPCGPERPSDLRPEVGQGWDRIYAEACCSVQTRLPNAKMMLQRYLQLFPIAQAHSNSFAHNYWKQYCAKHFPDQFAKRIEQNHAKNPCRRVAISDLIHGQLKAWPTRGPEVPTVVDFDNVGCIDLNEVGIGTCGMPRAFEPTPTQADVLQRKNLLGTSVPRIVTALILLAFFGFKTRLNLPGQPLTVAIPEAIGGTIAVLIIASIAAWVLALPSPKTRRPIARAWMLLVFSALCCLLVINVEWNRHQSRRFLTSEVVAALEEKKGNISPASPSKQFASKPKKASFETEVFELVQMMRVEGEILLQEVTKSWETLAAHEILSKTIGGEPKELESARSRVHEFTKKNESLEARFEELSRKVNQKVQEIARANANAQRADEFVAGFQATFEPSCTRNRQVFKAAHSYGTTLTNLLDFLLDRQGEYSVQNSLLVFGDFHSSEEYKRHISMLVSIEKQISEIAAEDQDSTHRALEKLKPYLHR